MPSAKTPPLMYWIIFGNPAHTIRKVYEDGTTDTWEYGDYGFQSALKRARKWLRMNDVRYHI